MQTIATPLNSRTAVSATRGSFTLQRGRSAVSQWLVVASLLAGGLPAYAQAAPAAMPLTAVRDTLEQRLEGCAACHGEQGQGGVNPYYPHLAGKSADYLYQQLKDFQSGKRNYPQMTYMVRFMDDAYLHEIANYYAHQTLRCFPVEAPRTDLSQVPVGAPIPAAKQTVAAPAIGASSVPPCGSKQ